MRYNRLNETALLMLQRIPTAHICQRQQLLQADGSQEADAARKKNVSIQGIFYRQPHDVFKHFRKLLGRIARRKPSALLQALLALLPTNVLRE
jgi:hypothetical protein